MLRKIRTKETITTLKWNKNKDKINIRVNKKKKKNKE